MGYKEKCEHLEKKYLHWEEKCKVLEWKGKADDAEDKWHKIHLEIEVYKKDIHVLKGDGSDWEAKWKIQKEKKKHWKKEYLEEKLKVEHWKKECEEWKVKWKIQKEKKKNWKKE